MRTYRIGSLFSGIGGLDWGFEKTGRFETVWQVEIDPFCRAVLEKHFPKAMRYEDVSTIVWKRTRTVDGLIGGFPCQDVSEAGRRQGIEGDKSGLWRYFADAVRVLRPGFLCIENVQGLFVRGIDRVLGDLSSLGYDAEWKTLRASDFGSPQNRARIFIVAYPSRIGCGTDSTVFSGNYPEDLRSRLDSWTSASGSIRSNRLSFFRVPQFEFLDVAHGIRAELDSIRSLGNAVVPPVAEYVAMNLANFLDKTYVL